jgi:antitoxin YefM
MSTGGFAMKTITATNARSDFFNILKRTIKGHSHYRISTKEGGAILLSEEDFESLIETLELLSTPGFAKSVKQAKKEIEKGQTYSMEEVFGKE